MIKNKITDRYSKRLGHYAEVNIEPLVYYLKKSGVKTVGSCGHIGEVMLKTNDKQSYLNAQKAIRKIKVAKAARLRTNTIKGKIFKPTRTYYEVLVRPSYLPNVTKRIDKIMKSPE